MHRISLAIALAGAVVATGCGGNVSPKSGTAPGVKDGTFKVTVQNGQGQPAGSALVMTKGKVTAGTEIDCGSGATLCEANIALDATITLTAAPTSPNIFLGWGGDCQGESLTCTLKGNADRYVVALFGAERTGHANQANPAVHDQQFSDFVKGKAGALTCTDCHGASLTGGGLTPSCGICHPQYQVDTFVQAIANRGQFVDAQENCQACHAGDGAYHQSIYNKYADATKLVATIDNVAVTPNTDGTFKTVVTFTLKNNGVAVNPATLQQKRYSAQGYNAATKTFDTNLAFSFSGLAATGTAGQYTVTQAKASYDITASNAFIYFYFGDKLVVPAAGHYNLMDNVVSVGKVYGTIDWASTATVTGCEKCHGSPYNKHGYRQAVVAGLGDFVACKACHTDQRGGVDYNLAMAYEDPARLAELEAIGAVCGGELCWSPEDETKYAYTATTMADTHMSHAKEFLYPQSMANCATCHEGKLDRILTDANFTGITCKSCHRFGAVAGVTDDAKRAPTISVPYHTFDWATGNVISNGVQTPCTSCHADNADVSALGGTNTLNDGKGPIIYGNYVPLLKDIHPGYVKNIYADNAGAKYASSVKMQIDSATFTPATNKVDVSFSVVGAAADALVKPTVVVSLYGYDTKDFIISGHSSQFTDKTPNLEWTEGALIRGTTLPANTSRLTVSPSTATAGNKTWTASIDLTTWSGLITSGAVKRIEIGVLPVLGMTQNAAVNTDPAKGTINPAIAIAGVTKTFDLVASALVDDAAVYGKAIVDPAKCNKCHDALGMTFHTPSYGSAGVVACRLCHFVGAGGSHLEMQSRSIDSYVHSIHSFQAFDVQNINFADEVQAFEYEHHIGSTYPNFTTLSCESCHVTGTYEAAAKDKSLPAILSASSTIKGKTRQIGGVPSVVVGPSSKACGGCHRAALIKEDAYQKLEWFDVHTGGSWGFRETPVAPATTTDVLNAKIQELLGTPTP